MQYYYASKYIFPSKKIFCIETHTKFGTEITDKKKLQKFLPGVLLLLTKGCELIEDTSRVSGYSDWRYLQEEFSDVLVVHPVLPLLKWCLVITSQHQVTYSRASQHLTTQSQVSGNSNIVKKNPKSVISEKSGNMFKYYKSHCMYNWLLSSFTQINIWNRYAALHHHDSYCQQISDMCYDKCSFSVNFKLWEFFGKTETQFKHMLDIFALIGLMNWTIWIINYVPINC